MHHFCNSECQNLSLLDLGLYPAHENFQMLVSDWPNSILTENQLVFKWLNSCVTFDFWNLGQLISRHGVLDGPGKYEKYKAPFFQN